MSDASQGEGWWEASDGKWYQPEDHPDFVDRRPPPPVGSVDDHHRPRSRVDGPKGKPKGRSITSATPHRTANLEIRAAISAAVAAATAFAPWAVSGNDRVSGVTGGPGIATLLLFGTAAAMSTLGSNKAMAERTAHVWSLVFAAVGTVIIDVVLARIAEAEKFHDLTGVVVGWGLIVGLIGGLVATANSFVALRDARGN